MIKSILGFFNKFETWLMFFSLVFFLDGMFTIIGTNKYGISIEANQQLVKCVLSDSILTPLPIIIFFILLLIISKFMWSDIHERYKYGKYFKIAYRTFSYMGLLVMFYATTIRWVQFIYMWYNENRKYRNR